METQDKLIQDLLNHLIDKGPTYASNYKRDNGISQYEWDQLIEAAVENDLIIDMNDARIGSFKIRPKGKEFGGNAYVQLKQKEREEIDRERLKKEDQERKEAVKLDNDILQGKRQKQVFWPGFAIAVIGGLLGAATFILKVTEKPKTDIKYIGVDSKGHVIEFTVKKD